MIVDQSRLQKFSLLGSKLLIDVNDPHIIIIQSQKKN